jgi:iron-sulfur cluster repair protein YtfE (RIC family)
MRNGSVEQQAVDQVVAHIPGARSVLRSYGIDVTNRLSLTQAAAAVSVTPDALLAELEDKARRLAHRSAGATPAPQEEPVLQEQAVGA